jgi:cell division protein FtsZ
MMGTGEATGERRAVQAAEAAIANPLLDEVSMKGARGLLISITGGNDLTLYEVDEAASRIRQEVDEEANIILGATFDSSLDGVVRVSVVATGIDKAIIDKAESAAAAAAIPPRVEPTVYSRPSPARYTVQQPAAMIELAAPVDAPASNVDTKGEVEVRAFAPKPVVYAEQSADRYDDAMEQEFVPPAPEQPVVRQTRMPKIEELPPIAQNQLRIQRGEVTTVAPQPETRRRSLLEKLAAFGISRQEDEASVRAVAPPAPARANTAGPQIDYSRPSQRATTQRVAQGQLDPHGRASPRVVASEDDQLEIPAFLRRQSGP